MKLTDSTSNAERPTLNAQRLVEVRIEELVLHGFAPNDRYAIGDAVERELARVFGEYGVPSSLRSEKAMDEIKGATFNATHIAKPAGIGRQIAHAIYGSLTPATASRRETHFSAGGSE